MLERPVQAPLQILDIQVMVPVDMAKPDRQGFPDSLVQRKIAAPVDQVILGQNDVVLTQPHLGSVEQMPDQPVDL